MTEITATPQCPSCGEKELHVDTELMIRIHADESWDLVTPFNYGDEDVTGCVACGWMGSYLQFLTAAIRPLLLTIHCTECNGRIELQLRSEDWAEWFRPDRRHVQDVFPYLTPAEREMLLTKICGDCFDLGESDNTPDEVSADILQKFIKGIDVNQTDSDLTSDVTAALERAVIALRHHPLPENCEPCHAEEEAEEPDTADDGLATWHRYDLYTGGAEDKIYGNSSTNDDNDDGVPEENTSWNVHYDNRDEMLKRTGGTHTGCAGCKVTVYLDGEMIDPHGNVIQGSN